MGKLFGMSFFLSAGLRRKFRGWCHCNSGATAIEYGLMAAGIALAVSVAVYAVGDNIVNLFDELTSYLDS